MRPCGHSIHPPSLALAVRGRSSFLFRWTIVFYIRYVELVPKIRGVFDETSPASRSYNDLLPSTSLRRGLILLFPPITTH